MNRTPFKMYVLKANPYMMLAIHYGKARPGVPWMLSDSSPTTAPRSLTDTDTEPPASAEHGKRSNSTKDVMSTKVRKGAKYPAI